MARNGVHYRTRAPTSEAEHHVNHGQSGPNDQDRPVVRNSRKLRVAPGRVDVAGSVNHTEYRRSRTDSGAGGQDETVDVELPPRAQFKSTAVIIEFQRDRFVDQPLGQYATHLVTKHLRQVLTVYLSRKKGVRVIPKPTNFRPTTEVGRIVVVSGKPTCRSVEKMLRIGRRVSNPGPEDAAPIDQIRRSATSRACATRTRCTATSVPLAPTPTTATVRSEQRACIRQHRTPTSSPGSNDSSND